MAMPPTTIPLIIDLSMRGSFESRHCRRRGDRSNRGPVALGARASRPRHICTDTPGNRTVIAHRCAITVADQAASDLAGAAESRANRLIGTCADVRQANQQHRHRRGAHDLLGIAADEEPADPLTSVRPDDDELRAPELRLLDDDVADAAAERLRQERVDLDVVRFDPCLRLRQDLRAGVDQDADDVGSGELGSGREDQPVDDVKETQARTGELGQPDRLVEAVAGRGAAVDRHEDSLIHGSSPQ